MAHSRDQQAATAPGWLMPVLGLFTAAMLGLAVYWGYKFEQATTSERTNLLPLLLWAVINAIIGAGATFWAWAYKPPVDGTTSPVAPAKLLALSVGGTLGLTTFVCLGGMYAYLNQDWNAALGTGRAAWKQAWMWIPVAAAIGGLVVMFLSLLAVRSEERRNPSLRRLIYGYNSFLTGLLLVAILALVNMMVHFYGSPSFDWTASHIYTISDDTKRILRDLKSKTTIYVIFPAGHPIRSDLEMLLSSFKQQNPTMIEHVSISPTSLSELPKMVSLGQQYGWNGEDSSEPDGVAKGVLVVVEKEGDKEVSDSVRRNQIEEVAPGGMGGDEGGGRTFKGEQVLVTSIMNLAGGKTNQTIYFTQGNGEPKLDDNMMSLGQNRGLMLLRRRLEEKGYAVKELSLVAATGSTPKVPDDAFAVVVPGPQSMEEAKVEALREYAKTPKGKVVVLVDVNRDKDWVTKPTGLEKFLAEYGVQVGQDVVINAYGGSAGVTAAQVVLAGQADRLFKDAFQNQDVFVFFEARSVRPAPGDNPKWLVTPLLETYKPRDRPLGQWSENEPGAALKGGQAQLVEYVKRKVNENETSNAAAFPLAVTVREKTDKPSADPHAFMKPDAQGTPKMVVFGDVTMITNFGLQEIAPDLYFDLFSGALGWLRERSDLIKEVKAKQRTDYKMQLTQEENRRMQLVPGLVLLIGLVGCGVGVMMMRKR